ncbi:MAG: hypothetical protein NVSMB25_07740 [Thermoleophilaceae bacterium]
MTSADATHELDTLREAGANTVRVDLSWSSLEAGGKGQHSDWFVLKADRYFQAAADRGIKVIATFWTTPCWASSAPESSKQGCAGSWWDRGVEKYAPVNAGDYADAAAWVAQRWGSKMAALEIWNEPNQQDFLKSSDPVGAYAQILTAAYPKIKQVAPNVTVLGGALADSDGSFLERLYADGISGSFDGFAIHPYAWQDPTIPSEQNRTYNFLSGVAWIHSIMAAHGDANTGLWLTEFGFSTCTDGTSGCVSESQQGSYLRSQFRLARGFGYVKAAIAYDLRNDAEAPDRISSYGLMHQDFTPKGGFQGFTQAMADQLSPNPGSSTPASPTPPPPSSGVVTAVPVPPAPGRPTIRVNTTGVATVKIACHAKRGRTRTACKGVVKLRARRARSSAHRGPGRKLGGQSFVIPAGHSMTVQVPVGRVSHAPRQRVIVTATTLQTSGRPTTAARVFSLVH